MYLINSLRRMEESKKIIYLQMRKYSKKYLNKNTTFDRFLEVAKK